MERSEIVLFVQIARKVVVKQNTALHGTVAVLCSYIVNRLFEFVRFVVLLVEKTQLKPVLVFKPDCRNGYRSKRFAEIVHLFEQLDCLFCNRTRILGCGGNRNCLEFH